MPRKRKKNVARTKSGRISRGAANYDKGTDRAQAMQALYGQDGCDAIGRAYRAGLLGDGQDAKAMLDTARRISNAYWANLAVGRLGSAIADKTSGGNSPVSPEKAREREERLNEALTLANSFGRNSRRFFDDLCIDPNPDFGPLWLDRLLAAQNRKGLFIEPADANALDAALEVLAELAGVDKPRVARLRAA